MFDLRPIPANAEGASYQVRVELPYPTSWEQYEQLHERMANLGLYKRIVSDDGVVYELPDAEYCGNVRLGYIALRDLVRGISDGIRPGSKVLVTEVVQWAWALERAA